MKQNQTNTMIKMCHKNTKHGTIEKLTIYISI